MLKSILKHVEPISPTEEIRYVVTSDPKDQNCVPTLSVVRYFLRDNKWVNSRQSHGVEMRQDLDDDAAFDEAKERARLAITRWALEEAKSERGN